MADFSYGCPPWASTARRPNYSCQFQLQGAAGLLALGLLGRGERVDRDPRIVYTAAAPRPISLRSMSASFVASCSGRRKRSQRIATRELYEHPHATNDGDNDDEDGIGLRRQIKVVAAVAFVVLLCVLVLVAWLWGEFDSTWAVPIRSEEPLLLVHTRAEQETPITPPLLTVPQSPPPIQPLPQWPPPSLPSPTPSPAVPPPPPLHPEPPGAPPPPYLLWPGPLSAATCEAALGDEAGLMRKMWAASPFQQRQPGTVDCWNVRRDSTRAHLDASRYFADALSGAHCPSNWYNGNPGTLGMQVPTFSGDAPALLGFDETIDTYCAAQPATNTAPDGGNWVRAV